MTTISINAPELSRALKLVKHAAGDDDSRPILSTILLEGDGDGFRLVAADNYRIGIATIEATGDVADFGRAPLPVSELPAVLAVLSGWKDGVEVTAKDDRLTFATKARSLTVHAMQGMYPAYMQVVAEGARKDIGVNPVFLSDLGRATKDAVARLRVGEPNAPLEVVVEDLAYREYIMPIRLGGQWAERPSEPEAVPA